MEIKAECTKIGDHKWCMATLIQEEEHGENRHVYLQSPPGLLHPAVHGLCVHLLLLGGTKINLLRK